MDKVRQNGITCTHLTLKDNEFSSNVYCDALIEFIRFSQDAKVALLTKQPIKTIDIEDKNNLMTDADYARLSQHAKAISITLPDESLLVYTHYTSRCEQWRM
jgi:hypothetical protein